MIEISRRSLDEMHQSDLVRSGHFGYQHGHHSAIALDRDRLLSDTQFASHLGYVIAKKFFTSVVDTVASPSMWGAALAQWVGYFLQPRATVVFARPEGDGFDIPETLAGAIAGRRVLLIDNLIITGETMRRFSRSVVTAGGEIIGAAALWTTAELEIDVFGVFNLEYPVYPAVDCPLCREGIPLERNPFPGWELASGATGTK